MDVEQSAAAAQELWLGYNELLVPFDAISALLVYQPVWDRRIAQAYGRVPSDVRAVVLLVDGRTLPARRTLSDLHARWTAWQANQPASEPDRGTDDVAATSAEVRAESAHDASDDLL